MAERSRGLSSFGYSGTIAHAVLGGIREVADPAPARSRAMVAFARPRAHPLLQRLEGSAFHTRVRSRLFAVLRDHTVSGRVLFPGAGSAEMALACARGALAGLRFTRPLILVEGVAIGIRALEISREARGVVSMHASARDGHAPASVAPLPTAVAVDVRALYAGLAAAGGLMYGPSFRTVGRAWTGREAVAAAIAVGHNSEGYRVHPATTDGMLQSMAVTAGATATQVPASIGGLGLVAGAPSAALVWSCTRSTLTTASESRARCALVRRLNVDDFCSRALSTGTPRERASTVLNSIAVLTFNTSSSMLTTGLAPDLARVLSRPDASTCHSLKSLCLLASTSVKQWISCPSVS